ncbi:VWA domain-containing protein [Dactylosporangium sp. NPDC049140]|uniref:vWA domain-containing protein n=1 Tax=Dactylosporangium sp. NPDC049140 TaxID=3155647 RepID=UPI0033F03C63
MTENRRATEDNRILVLAFYVVVDVSQSMQFSGAIEEVNKILPQVADAIDGSPMLGDLVRFGAMDFADDARVLLRLGDLRDVQTALPTFTTRGRTSYAAAFRLLRQEIERDLAQLRSDNLRVYRPAVFFITDGEPTDEEFEVQAAFDELTDPSFPARPNILPFGVGTATKEALDRWIFPKTGGKAMRSYLSVDVDPRTAIARVTEALLASIIASAASVSSAGQSGGFMPPDDEDLDDWI